jgi:hypothetical protein
VSSAAMVQVGINRLQPELSDAKIQNSRVAAAQRKFQTSLVSLDSDTALKLKPKRVTWETACSDPQKFLLSEGSTDGITVADACFFVLSFSRHSLTVVDIITEIQKVLSLRSCNFSDPRSQCPRFS